MSEFSNVQKEYLESLFIKLNNKIDEKINELHTDFKQQIGEIKQEITTRYSHFEEKITNLENKNKKLEHSLCNLERKVRKNNIVIFGINETEHDVLKRVTNIFQNILELEIREYDLNDVYRLENAKSNKKPVIVEFISYRNKISVLKNAKKLKGTNIYIAKDQCIEDQKKNKILVKHLKAAREKGAVAYIKGQKLYVSNQSYTIDQLEEETGLIDAENANTYIEETEITENRAKSAPPTPTPNPETRTKRQAEELETDDQNEQKKPKSRFHNIIKTRSNSGSKN